MSGRIGISWLAIIVFIFGLWLLIMVLKHAFDLKRRQKQPPMAPRHHACEGCGFLNRPTARYCGQCGQVIEADSEAFSVSDPTKHG